MTFLPKKQDPPQETTVLPHFRLTKTRLSFTSRDLLYMCALCKGTQTDTHRGLIRQQVYICNTYSMYYMCYLYSMCTHSYVLCVKSLTWSFVATVATVSVSLWTKNSPFKTPSMRTDPDSLTWWLKCTLWWGDSSADCSPVTTDHIHSNTRAASSVPLVLCTFISWEEYLIYVWLDRLRL